MTSASRHGILTMVAAMAFFVVNDALVKLASNQVPTAQLIFLRGLVTTGSCCWRPAHVWVVPTSCWP